jgi:hypothetical protein
VAVERRVASAARDPSARACTRLTCLLLVMPLSLFRN